MTTAMTIEKGLRALEQIEYKTRPNNARLIESRLQTIRQAVYDLKRFHDHVHTDIERAAIHHSPELKKRIASYEKRIQALARAAKVA